MAGIADRKIRIFMGQNDVPSAPDTTKAGNGSHLIAQFNLLIDDLTAQLATMQAALDAAIAKNTAQDTSITAVNTKNTAQDTSISTINTSITTINTKNTAQDTSIAALTTRVTNLETKPIASTGLLPSLSIDFTYDSTLIGTTSYGYMGFDVANPLDASIIYASNRDYESSSRSWATANLVAGKVIQLTRDNGSAWVRFVIDSVTPISDGKQLDVTWIDSFGTWGTSSGNILVSYM